MQWLKNMIYIDANIICRHLLQDNDELSKKAKEVITKNECFVTYEVFAEVVYVLLKVYQISRADIVKAVKSFLPSIKIENSEVLNKCLDTFSETKLDFVDCLLFAYNKVLGIEIATFDKKLMNKIKGKLK